MRKGFNGLSALAEKVLERDPYSGHLFVLRGRRGDLVKVIWFDGQGACLFSKRLERGRFVWPSIVSRQLIRFLEGTWPGGRGGEMVFAKLKALLREAAERTVDTLWRQTGKLLTLLSPEECRNYLRHAGYGTT